jgi:hypothetical protein
VTRIGQEIPGGVDVGCSSCAFRAGCETRHEPLPVLEAALCVLGGIPFYCHHDKAGRDFHASKDKPTMVDLVVCEGWKREVRAASRDPRWRKKRMLRRTYAQIGIEALNVLTAGADEATRKHALGQVRDAVEALVLAPRPEVPDGEGKV